MARISIPITGQIGQIDEIPSHMLPPGAWTAANNIDFRDGVARKSRGYSIISTGTDTDPLLARPQWMMPYSDPSDDTLYWIYTGAADDDSGLICTFDGEHNVDRTDTATYTGNYEPVTVWSGAVVKGLAVVNNEDNIPQMWGRTSGVLKSTFEDLTNWPSTKTCKALRGFKDFFIAMNIHDSSLTPQTNPYEIMHSGIVDPYTPPEWTPSTTNRAGSKYIAEGSGYIIDGLPLRDSFYIYTSESTFIMRFIGGNEVFSVDRVFSEYGLFARRCVKPFKDGMHFLVSVGDIVIHDGNQAQSICDGKVRDNIFDNIDTTYFENSFVISHYNESEMWFCYPTSGSIYANRAAKWNIKSGAWSFMDFPNPIAHIGYGVIPTGTGAGGGVWNTDTEVWNDDATVWNQSNYNPSVKNLMMANIEATIADSALLRGDDSNTFNGSLMPSFTRREDLTVIDNGSSGPVSDPSVYKYCTAVVPRIDGSDTINIRVGGRDELTDTIHWDGPYIFDPTTDYKVDVDVSGRYLSVEFSSDADVAWGLTGYDLDIVRDGIR